MMQQLDSRSTQWHSLQEMMTHLSLIDRMASCGNGAYGGPTISDRPYGGDDQQFYAAQRPSMIVKGPVPQSSHRARLNTLAAVAYLAVAKHTTTLAVILTALVIGGVIGFGWPAPGHPTAWTDIRIWVSFAVATISVTIALIRDGQLRERGVQFQSCEMGRKRPLGTSDRTWPRWRPGE